MTDGNPKGAAYYPGQAPIDSYGRGGFRFAEMSHQGGLILLPSGIYGWGAATMNDVTPEALERVWEEGGAITMLLLGTGACQHFPDQEISVAACHAGLGLEAMSTGAAARTYNVLLAEGRAIGAALLPAD